VITVAGSNEEVHVAPPFTDFHTCTSEAGVVEK
jgi:hypothetical protein